MKNYNSYSSKPEKHLNSYIHSIITYIKKFDAPVPFTTIIKSLNINLYQNPMILQALKKNAKILVSNDKIEYKPTYDVRTKEDLVNLLISVNGSHGIEFNELVDSPIDVKVFIHELFAENRIYMLKDSDGSQVIFYNDTPMPKASDDVRSLYGKIRVPEYQDMLKELRKSGLKGGHDEKKRKVDVEQTKKNKKYKRKIKITNTHVKDLNFN